MGRRASAKTTSPPVRVATRGSETGRTRLLLGVLDLGRGDVFLAVLLGDDAGDGAFLRAAAAHLFVIVFGVPLVLQVVRHRLAVFLHLNGGRAFGDVLFLQFALGAH